MLRRDLQNSAAELYTVVVQQSKLIYQRTAVGLEKEHCHNNTLAVSVQMIVQ